MFYELRVGLFSVVFRSYHCGFYDMLVLVMQYNLQLFVDELQ